jgi:hypothetical protein
LKALQDTANDDFGSIRVSNICLDSNSIDSKSFEFPNCRLGSLGVGHKSNGNLIKRQDESILFLHICRQEVLTFAPRLANSSAMPEPIPREPPVTTAIFPERLFDIMGQKRN